MATLEGEAVELRKFASTMEQATAEAVARRKEAESRAEGIALANRNIVRKLTSMPTSTCDDAYDMVAAYRASRK